MDKISIILCCRSLDSIHRKTIQSIKNQTYDNIQLIIEQGTDNNQLVRNRGFEKSNGKYVFFCDEDIILQPDCILKLYRSLCTGNYAFSYCNYQRSAPFNDIQYGRTFDLETLHKINYISTMSLISRNVFPGFDPDIKRLQDYDLFLTITESGHTGVWCDEVLFLAIYRKNCISLGKDLTWEESMSIVRRKHKLIEDTL